VSYFTNIVDDNNRKPICRLYFNNPKKFIGIFDEKKAETKIAITSLGDRYKQSELLLKVAEFYKDKKNN